MHDIDGRGARGVNLSGAARDLATLAYVALETLAARQYAAPWRTAGRDVPRER